MSYYKQCEYCGAHLDPGERCDCEAREPDDELWALAELLERFRRMTKEQRDLVIAFCELHRSLRRRILPNIKNAARCAATQTDGKAENGSANISAPTVSENGEVCK